MKKNEMEGSCNTQQGDKKFRKVIFSVGGKAEEKLCGSHT
jgi:hypothetical protein